MSCFFSDGVEVRIDGQMVRLEFCVDGEPVVQVAIMAGDIDDMVADYLRLLGERDGRQASILAFKASG